MRTATARQPNATSLPIKKATRNQGGQDALSPVALQTERQSAIGRAVPLRDHATLGESDIDATKWTHINFAVALIDKTTYEVAQMAPTDIQQYMQLTDLKRDNQNLKVFISIGGWDTGGATFSDMVSSPSRRSAFIDSLKRFLKQYIFDGVDINWQYPVAEDRGGNQADLEIYVVFMEELRAELGTKHGVTATLPFRLGTCSTLNVKNLEKHLDWFNMQTYDLHGKLTYWDSRASIRVSSPDNRVGKWNSEAPTAESFVQAHSNLTEIDQGLDLLWRNGIDPQKVVLGLGFYGRAFTLEIQGCSKPGCDFSGSAKEGACTEQSGILSNSEIQDIITENGITPILVKEDAVKYFTWDSNQWVSYDDYETFRMKREYANSVCLGGMMVWPWDLDNPIEQTSVNDLLGSEMSLNSKWNTLSSRRAITRSNALTLGLFWTACQPPSGTADGKMCPEGYRPIAMGHG
ncbi:glycoside hydrolase family 18 protein [Hortaea werneckii]|nr:glycoside hydrolase family 18 protein [Hortaea werneckii]